MVHHIGGDVQVPDAWTDRHSRAAIHLPTQAQRRTSTDDREKCAKLVCSASGNFIRICLSTCPSVHWLIPSVRPSVSMSVHPSIRVSISASGDPTRPFVSMSVHLPIRLSACLSVHESTGLHVHSFVRSACQPVCLPLHSSGCRTIHLHACPSMNATRTVSCPFAPPPSAMVRSPTCHALLRRPLPSCLPDRPLSHTCRASSRRPSPRWRRPA
jgi:hypothetical protein